MENRIIKFACGGRRSDRRSRPCLSCRTIEIATKLQRNGSATEKGRWWCGMTGKKSNRECCEHLCGFVNELTESRIDIAAAWESKSKQEKKKEFSEAKTSQTPRLCSSARQSFSRVCSISIKLRFHASSHTHTQPASMYIISRNQGKLFRCDASEMGIHGAGRIITTDSYTQFR